RKQMAREHTNIQKLTLTIINTLHESSLPQSRETVRRRALTPPINQHRPRGKAPIFVRCERTRTTHPS
ncbi:hypothetical protein, partial [Paenarthrobacter sp. Z7-10]|uniref:hypothetical protein n=1 Tax=Paenarthrobacter sp. Z7-10 TaxID=2787635 RepID=UPI0022A90D29